VIKKLLPLLAMTLLLPLTSSTACIKEVPVATPATPCNLGPFPTFPSLSASACPDSDQVCMSPDDAAAIWLWARDTSRWAEHATVCLDVQALAAPGIPVSAAAPIKAPYGLEELLADMYHPAVEVDVYLEQCGVVNAYYFPAGKYVTLCVEILAFGPGVSRYVLAHELAHAVIMQLDLPIPGSQEAAADELAAYVLIRTGRVQDLLDATTFWLNADGDPDPWDDHPTHLQRAWAMGCLALESLGEIGTLPCERKLDRVLRTWDRLFGRS
jgi:hypothetical protein